MLLTFLERANCSVYVMCLLTMQLRRKIELDLYFYPNNLLTLRLCALSVSFGWPADSVFQQGLLLRRTRRFFFGSGRDYRSTDCACTRRDGQAELFWVATLNTKPVACLTRLDVDQRHFDLRNDFAIMPNRQPKIFILLPVMDD